jgi:hypothetical protein
VAQKAERDLPENFYFWRPKAEDLIDLPHVSVRQIPVASLDGALTLGFAQIHLNLNQPISARRSFLATPSILKG